MFIGPQGTGKSLVAQTLYSFEELPFLMYYAAAQRGAAKKDEAQLFRWILDHLRSSQRSFGTFANPKVTVRWSRSALFEGFPSEQPDTFEFRAYRATRQITVGGATSRFLERLRRLNAKTDSLVLHHAIFFPTERIVVSQIQSAMVERLLALPITYWLFTHWLDDHVAPAVGSWPGGAPDTDEGKEVHQLGLAALGGHARKRGAQWKWTYGSGSKRSQFDLDMASSGQRSNWSLPFIAQTLFTLRSTGDIADELTVFVEEPEIHLHPAAQRSMVQILALLVNAGFRVVVTTHSLTVLYALNNLIQASRLMDGELEGTPPPDRRLSADDVSVYAFAEGAAPRQLVDTEKAFIDESELGAVGEELSAELNRVIERIDEQG